MTEVYVWKYNGKLGNIISRTGTVTFNSGLLEKQRFRSPKKGREYVKLERHP